MKLAVKYFSDHREWFLRAMLGMAVLVALSYMPTLTGLGGKRALISFLTVMAAASIILVTFKMTSGYVVRKTGVMDMLTPASAGAKFRLAWGVSLFGTLAVFMATVLALNTLLHHTAGTWLSNIDLFDVRHPSVAQVWEWANDYFFAMCIIHGVVLLGTLTATTRGGFWKRALGGVIVFATACIMIIGLPQWLGMPENATTKFPFFLEMGVRESIEGAALWQTISWAADPLRRVLSVVVAASAPLAMWVAAWFKFKELEVR